MSAWTDERIERLRTCVADGKTATTIAAEFGGGMTRNGIIGKCHRLGLKLRDGAKGHVLKPVEELVRPRAKPPKVQPFLATPKREIAIVPVIVEREPFEIPKGGDPHIAPPSALLVDLLDLRDRHCRWTFRCDDGVTRYCGRATADGSWCATHGARVFSGERRPTMKAYAPTASGRSFHFTKAENANA